MDLYLTQAVNGIGIGMIYFLISVGLSFVFGLMGFVNFAQGAFYMLGAYACHAVAQATGSFWAGIAAAPLAVAALALATEAAFLERLYQRSHFAQVLATLGLALVIKEAVVMAWGPVGLHLSPPAELRGFVFLDDMVYPKYRLFVILASAALALALWLGIEKTRYGALLRAGTESTETASLLGIRVTRLFSATFAAGAALSGLAGALTAPIRGISPSMDSEALAVAFVAVIIGGMGSFLGTLAACLMIGIVQSLMSTAWSAGADIMIYAVMALVIIARPRGLLGRA